MSISTSRQSRFGQVARSSLIEDLAVNRSGHRLKTLLRGSIVAETFLVRRGFSNATLRRSIGSPVSRMSLDILANTVQSRPPENRMASRLGLSIGLLVCGRTLGIEDNRKDRLLFK